MKNVNLKAQMALLPLAISAMATTGIAQAQNQLKETVVTATRSQSRADAIISDVTVITREDIERSTGRSVAELLARVGGVQMVSNGGLGKSSSVFIRGTESRHVLLLVDGVRYGSATLGTPNFDNIPLESIERIEVLKGPASALYGSDAVGGVVQIFTRKGAPGFHPYASLTVGGLERHELSTGFNGGNDAVSYSLGVQTLREKGFSATNPLVAFGAFNPDTDGFMQSGFNASLGFKIAPNWKLTANLLYSDALNQRDNGPTAFDARIATLSNIAAVGLEGQVSSSWTTRIGFAASEDRSTDWTAPASTFFNTKQDQISWLNEVATPVGKVVVGLEQLVQNVNSTTAYTVNKRITDSYFAGLTGGAGAHTWQANVRRDQDSQFGGASTGLAGYGYKFTPNWRAHGSFGTSFKAPSFNALYFPAFGNATTQPEYGENSELGLAYTEGAHQVKLTTFVNRIKGFITTLPVVANIPFARIQGSTLAYDGQAGDFSFRAALDVLDARNELTGLKLARRADQQWTAGISYAKGPWKFGAALLSASQRFEDAANTVALAPFTTVDLSADYAVNKDWSLQGRVVNATDASYQTALGFNQPGSGLYLTLRYQPK